MAPDPAERPNRIPWPPLLYGAALAIGLVADRIVPLPLGLGSAAWIGLPVAALGLGLDLWTLATFARAKTNVLPHRPAGRLLVHGPFARTRNPIYLGNTILVAGLGLLFDTAWLLVGAAAAALACHHLAILREEAHLAARFGPDWHAYAARVPRWIGWRTLAGRRDDAPDR